MKPGEKEKFGLQSYVKVKGKRAKNIAEENVLLTVIGVAAILVWWGKIAPDIIWKIVTSNPQLSLPLVILCGAILFAPLLLVLGWWIFGDKKLKAKEKQKLLPK